LAGPVAFARVAPACCACLVLLGCAQPLVPFSSDTPPLALVPATQAGVVDRRARFREIFTAVLEAHGRALPDYRPCEESLSRVGPEPPGAGKPVDLGPSRRHLVAAVVPGIGFECIEQWLEAPGTVAAHLRTQGFDQITLKVDALSGTTNNARQIRDALLAMPAEGGPPRLVLVGYSKGAPDVLEAIVRYPEIRGRVAAVVSAAGAVGGSPLANDAEQYEADLLRHFPGATCTSGDGEGVASLRPDRRRTWLAENPLPADLHYYSLVTFPRPDHISQILQSSYRKLAAIDGRNDSQVIFYDQIIPGSTLMGYVNADHWAVALPIARSHKMVGSLLVTHNAYPREALLEAVLRFVEEDLDQRR
jgi:dienelactone hydrolase